VLRTGKKWAAAATLLCDGLKGAVAVLFVRAYLPPGCEIFAALAAVLGHIYPVWLKFKGGKGVATFIGVTAALYWPVGLLVAASWLLAALVWRISSLSALIAIALSPAYFYVLGRHEYAPVAAPLAVLIFYTHRENIRRLLAGAEPRIDRAK
jgi:glycerol-3-phosphate acyltransferase PlsY